jgi:hypothetical protein
MAHASTDETTGIGVSGGLSEAQYHTRNGVTLGFSIRSNVWRSRYSYTPTCYSTVDNIMVSHMRPNDPNNTQLDGPHYYMSNSFSWNHELDSDLSFYLYGANSQVEVVSNYNPSAVKIFKAISIEGDGGWTGNSYTNVGRGGPPEQSSFQFEFDVRENNLYSHIPPSTTVESLNNQMMFVGFVNTADLLEMVDSIDDHIVDISDEPETPLLEKTFSSYPTIKWTIPLATHPKSSIPTSEDTALWFGFPNDAGQISGFASLQEVFPSTSSAHGGVTNYNGSHEDNVLRPIGYDSATNSIELMTEMNYELASGEADESLGIPNLIDYIVNSTTAQMIPIYVSQNARKTGEIMRGPYLGVNLSGEGEIFAINVEFEKTKLDGSLG